MNKKALSERDICTKFITPALVAAGWDIQNQLREEVSFTKGRVIVRGRMTTRGEAKRADCILYYNPNVPIAGIEAKDNNQVLGAPRRKHSGLRRRRSAGRWRRRHRTGAAPTPPPQRTIGDYIAGQKAIEDEMRRRWAEIIRSRQ